MSVFFVDADTDIRSRKTTAAANGMETRKKEKETP
jgi:hypothetical protein